MKILHIINSLDLGGAEKNLYTICKNDDQNEHIVISLKNFGYFGKKLEGIKVKVFQINLDKNFLNFFKIITILIKTKPNLVQTWMYISDLIGSLVCVITFKYNLIWGVRHTNLNPKIEKKRTLIISIDNRASEISSDIGLNVAARGSENDLKNFINHSFETSVIIPEKNISIWKNQF